MSTIKLTPTTGTVSMRPVRGVKGPQGAPGGSDEATADWVENGPLTSAALSATIADQAQGRYTRIDVVADHSADNTGATSAVAAFEAALAAANTALGKVEIIVPPGTYDLTAGLTTAIANNHVHIVGGGMGVTILNGGTGTLFAFGNGGASIIGGGLRDLSLTYASPVAGSRVIHINGGSSQKFRSLFLDNVHQLARLGESGALASAPSFRHIYGSTDPAAGSVVIDAAYGTALSLNDVILNAKGVGFPADTTSLHAANDTTFLRFGQGSWDTAHCWEVISNRYNRGLDINIEAANVVSNLWFYGCIWDYNKTNGIRLRTNHAGANLRSAYFMGGWAVATDAHSIEVAGTLGAMKNVHFTDVVGRQSGKNNWRFSGSVMERVNLASCHGIGANRLDATNAGSEKDDLVILGGGVCVNGGSFGEDGSSYTGFVNQGRYGITRSADIVVQITDAEVTGATGAFQAVTDTASDRRRLVTRNRRSTNALPEYATTTAVVAPTSAAVQTHAAGTHDTLYIYGGTVTSIIHNSTEVGTTGPATLTLRPGDTWSVTYSAAPTIKRVVAP